MDVVFILSISINVFTKLPKYTLNKIQYIENHKSCQLAGLLTSQADKIWIIAKKSISFQGRVQLLFLQEWISDATNWWPDYAKSMEHVCNKETLLKYCFHYENHCASTTHKCINLHAISRICIYALDKRDCSWDLRHTWSRFCKCFFGTGLVKGMCPKNANPEVSRWYFGPIELFVVRLQYVSIISDHSATLSKVRRCLTKLTCFP